MWTLPSGLIKTDVDEKVVFPHVLKTGAYISVAGLLLLIL